MQTPSQTAPASVAASEQAALPARSHEDLAYQAVTVAAILLLLGSLWVF
jgi:hypothetical protein